MKNISLLVLSVLISYAGNAQEPEKTVTVTQTQTITVVNDDNTSDVQVSPQEDGIGFSHFSWGADLGSSIDMTGQDMTSFDISAHFGYKGRFVRFAGIGAGIKMMVSNSSRSYPIYAMFRSGFSSKPTFCFLDIKGGIAISNLHNTINQTGLYGAIGIGFTLAKGRNFSSHIIAGYELIPLNDIEKAGEITRFNNLHMASVRIGASF